MLTNIMNFFSNKINLFESKTSKTKPIMRVL